MKLFLYMLTGLSIMKQKSVIFTVVLILVISVCVTNSYLNARYINRDNSVSTQTILQQYSSISSSFFLGFGNETSKNDNLFVPQPKLGINMPISGNLDQMKHFFSALKNVKNKKVRIAHYGDSLLMGDIITEYLRKNFQEIYQGKGVGYVSIASDDYRMRRTLAQSFSDDWNNYSFITRNPEQLQFGINGTLAIPKPGSWVKYETTSTFKTTNSFDIVRVFYGNAQKNSLIKYAVNGGSSVPVSLETGDDLKVLSIAAKNSTKFYLQFVSGSPPCFYGISLESNEGVYVDNFAMRGNSGASLQELSPKTLQDFNKHLSYDLIILNYGANVSSPNKGVYSVYENKMVSIINDFKKSFPNTSFLIVSAADKTVKRGSQFITNPDIPLLLEAQKRISERTGVAFWNLWEVMGGSNSMTNWVNAAPPQALKDYSHFTYEGGERVGELLFNAIIEAYNNSNK